MSPPTSLASIRILTTRRPTWVHWTAWAAAFAAILVAMLWKWGSPDARGSMILQSIDVGLALFFCAEIFTRSGFRHAGLSYFQWRWFDYIAILPVIALGPMAVAIAFWPVLICRVIRLVDRTLGDGFITRNALVLVSIVEEEISDRLLDKMLSRWDDELQTANFGTVMSKALARNKEAVLQRVFAEQLQDGAFAKIAHFTGLQATLEKEERRLFAAVVEMVGSDEVDNAIRDVIGASIHRAREQLSVRDWRRKVGIAMRADPVTLGRPAVAKRLPSHSL